MLNETFSVIFAQFFAFLHSLQKFIFRENGGHWLVCYSCHTSRDEKLTTSTNQEEENKLSEAVEFGTNMLNELLLPPWTMSDEEKKFESIQEALAFVQVSEMIAGKILSILPPGQKATLSIDKVSTILLQTIPESHKTRYTILRDVQSSFIDLGCFHL